jgi:activator of HSP90 ATPase
MAKDSLEVSTILAGTLQDVFEAWLDGTAHSAFTGSPATGEPRVGGAFTAWDGYIWGINSVLEPYRRIVQSWRTTEFPRKSPDSLLVVELASEGKGTQLTLTHTDIPAGQGKRYEAGWIEFYVEPLKKYFGAPKAKPARKAAMKPAAKKPASRQSAKKPRASKSKAR